MEVTLPDLWLPILLGGLAVFLSSFVLRMLLKYHWNDFDPLPDEGKIRAAFQGVPGDRR